MDCWKGLMERTLSRVAAIADLTIPMRFSRARNFAAARKMKKHRLQRAFFGKKFGKFYQKNREKT